MRNTKNLHQVAGAILVILAVSLCVGAGDQGFDVISEGVVKPSAGPSFDIVLFGTTGYSIVGAFWASAGARISFTMDAFEIQGSASAGTDGTQLQAGVTTELFGFGTAADVAYTLGGTPIITARGWGTVAGIGLTANATLAGTAVSLLVGGNMDFDSYGVSASLGFGNGTFNTASVGANTSLGALSLSANGGWAAGQFTVGGGAGLVLGPVQITANAGYNGGLGINAVLSAGLGWPAFQMTAVAMLDNTGVGIESTAQLVLGDLILSAVGQFGGGDLGVEIGASIPMGSLTTAISVALDNATGFAWAEASFEWPL